MKLHVRQFYDKAKDSTLDVFRKLAKGMSFEEIATTHLLLVRRVLPTFAHFSVECVVIYFLFHIYLLYAITYSISKLIVKQTKVKGAKLIPNFGGWKEQIKIFVTSLVVFHWFSSFSLATSSWTSLFSWAMQIRPQITIKPQIKVVTRTNSCHSIHSIMSFSMEDYDTDVRMSLAPSDDVTRSTLRRIQSSSRSISTATDLLAASVSTRSRSQESNFSWESFGSDRCEDEIDLDEELENIGNNTSFGLEDFNSGWNNQELPMETSDDVEFESEATTPIPCGSVYSTPDNKFMTAARKVLNTKLGLSSWNSRPSRIPRPSPIKSKISSDETSA